MTSCCATALAFLALHLVMLLIDPSVHFTVTQILVPGIAPWKPIAVALGTIAFWLLIPVSILGRIRQRLGKAGIDVIAHIAMHRFAVEQVKAGKSLGFNTSAMKIAGADALHGVTDLLLDAAGTDAASEEKPVDDGQALDALGLFLLSRRATIWGGAADANTIYYGLTGGGVVAVQLATGEKTWFNPMEPPPGHGRAANSAAVTAIPGAVISGFITAGHLVGLLHIRRGPFRTTLSRHSA